MIQIPCLALGVEMTEEETFYIRISVMISFLFFFPFCYDHGMWKFPAQAANLRHSHDLIRSSGNTRSYNHYTRELHFFSWFWFTSKSLHNYVSVIKWSVLNQIEVFIIFGHSL